MVEIEGIWQDICNFHYDCFDEDNTLKYLRLGNECHINSGIKSA